MARHQRARAAAAIGGALLLTLSTAGTATADPVGAGKASSFAITADVFGTQVIPPTPTASLAAPAADEVDETLIAIPGDPLVVNGTLIARAAVHAASDLPSELTLAEQEVAGPYNARAIGQIEDLSLLLHEDIPGEKLISADLIRAEAVAVCSAGSVSYSASSEVVDLRIAGDGSLNGPLNELVTQIADGIHNSPLAELVDIELNVVTPTATGISVDAIVITVLRAAEEGGAPGPLAKIVLGHAEVSGAACAGDEAPAPECSDGIDNLDPEDTLADAADPGCHTDGDAANPATYDPNDDDERDEAVLSGGALPKTSAALPSTGAGVATGVAATLGAGALALLALRRRLT